MSLNRTLLASIALATAFSFPDAAMARNSHSWVGQSGFHNGYYHDRGRVIVVNEADRATIREYGYSNYSIPAGQARRAYVIGEPLPVAYQPLPRELQSRLHPVPAGFRYVVVDGDVLIITNRNSMVVDAVSFL